jgi:copper ion binding protein
MAQIWKVQGMTCQHCVATVIEEVGELPGVRSVDVVLETGELTVHAEPPLAKEVVRAALEEAGYQLV